MTDDDLLARCRSQEYHYTCEDCWYSCPMSSECCNDEVGNECNCGYDRRVKEKMELYRAGEKAGYKAGLENVKKEMDGLGGYKDKEIPYILKKWLDTKLKDNS